LGKVSNFYPLTIAVTVSIRKFWHRHWRTPQPTQNWDWAVDQLKGACIVLAKDQTGQCTALTSDLLLPGIFRQSVPHSSEKRKFY
jgi:hypothetical protein